MALYSRIPILSSIISRDVERARHTLNFSEWSDRTGLKPALAASTLMASCALIQAGKMPKAPYPFFHAAARLSEQDKNQFCEWSKMEAMKLVERRHRAEGGSGIDPGN